MAENDDQSNLESEPPLDDYGIHQDRLLEICEKIIEKTHTKYVLDDYTPKTASEFRDVAETLEKVWGITQDILNLDDVIRSAVDALNDPDNQEGNGEFDDDQNDDFPDDKNNNLNDDEF